jgi:hypothetical protein
MTRGVPIVYFLLRLALLALVWACTYLAVAFVAGVVTRLLIASVLALTVWWISRDMREID